MPLGIYFNKIPIYPIFYLLKGDYKSVDRRWDFGLRVK